MPVSPLSCTYGNCIIPQRYVLCFLVFLGIVLLYSTRVCLHITITKMVVPIIHNKSNRESGGEVCVNPDHRNDSIKGGEFKWTESQQGIILAAFFPGYVITHLPGGIIADKFGGKHIFSGGIAISGLLTLLTPVAVHYGDWWCLTIVRVIMGFAQGPVFPSMTTLLAKWVPQRERSTLGAFVTTGAQLGTIVGNYLSSLLLTGNQSWKTVFYFWGAIAILWYPFFFFFCYSEPAEHPFLPDKEAVMLEEQIGATEKMKIPWKSIFTYRPVWALIIGAIGHDWLFFLVVVEMPKYMGHVLKFNIQQNGILNSVPYLTLWVCSNVSGYVADLIIAKQLMTVLNMRRLLSTIGNIAPVIFIMLASVAGCNREIAATMFTLSIFTMGPYYPGMRVNPLDISKNFAGIMMAIINGIGAVSFMPLPYIIGLVTQDHSIEQWRNVFWAVLVVVLVTNTVYLLWASGDRAEWDKRSDQ